MPKTKTSDPKMRIDRVLLVLILILVLSSSISCCLKAKKEYTPKETIQVKKIVDDFGYTVVVKGYPKRIVSLSPATTEILFALGLGDKVVGVTDQCNYPPEVLEMKKNGSLVSVGGYSSINVEKVISLNPDLVIASYGNGIKCVEAIKSFGIPVVCLNPKNISGIIRDIEILGEITGSLDEAKELEKFIIKEVQEVKRRIKLTKHRPTVAHVIWYNPIWVSGRDTFVDEIIQIAGGQNAFNKSGWFSVSLEEFVSANPDIIIVNSGTGMNKSGKNIIYEWLMSEEILKSVKAIKNKKVYVIDADIISRPSYRLVYALKQIARYIHPEVFEEKENLTNFTRSSYYNLSNSSMFWSNNFATTHAY